MSFGGNKVFFKKLVTGVLLITMSMAMGFTGFSAFAETDYSKKVATLEKTIYKGNDLGANYTENHTVFKVWAPDAKKVRVRIYETGSDDENGAKTIATKDMALEKSTGVWSARISGNLKNKYYTYIITRNKKDVETADIYARGAGVNGNRSMVVDLADTNPEGWDDDKHITVDSQTDASVWETSVRDFSVSPTSGVSEKNRGKFLAFTEKGTTVDGIEGNPATCVDYLKNLGVKYVQIMPFYDFGSIDESKDLDDQYNWGYDPKNYNVPEGSYSSNPYKGEVRIKECKEMIKALHDAGIGVIMDVVYNHTYTVEDSFFNLTVPDYYYRKNSDGSWSNGSGCGNDTASEHKMFRKYMIDSVTYWASEYHIDGFRFDLMGLHDVETMNQIRAALDKLDDGKKIIMYGEAWNLSTSAKDGTVLATQDNMYKLNERIGAFDDTIRDAIKGSGFVLTEQGFVQNGSRKGNLRIGIAGQSNPTTGWAKAPTQCVTYASCHDNYTLYDKLVASIKGQDSNYRKRYDDLVAMNKLSAAITFTSQGIPFVLSGEEFARSKDGEGNSYNTTNAQNELVWSDIITYGDLVNYYKGLMEIREVFTGFKDPSSTSAQNIKYFEDLPDGVVAYSLKNDSDNLSYAIVIFNGNSEKDQKLNINIEGLPEEWVTLANADTAGLINLGTVKGEVTVPKSSAVILVDKKSYDTSKIDKEEGVVVVKYYNKNSGEVFAADTLKGKIGTEYDLSENHIFSKNYDIVNTEGKAKGKFGSDTQYVNIYCEKYEGAYSSVTFKFLDAANEGILADSIVMSNREGQRYTTYSIPTIIGYNLDMDNLPQNGCGEFGAEDITVVYKYNRTTGDQMDVCRVNSIYMDTDGKILDKVSVTGEENKEYESEEKEFSGYSLVQSPYNSRGTFVKGEVNILYIYSPNQDSSVPIMITICSVGALLLICAGIFAVSTVKSKKSNKKELDIEE